jgi:hypothetical protein
MVSNVLSMRNMETGELEMHPAAFDPHAALNDLLQARLAGVARLHARCDIHVCALTYTFARAGLPPGLLAVRKHHVDQRE